ncbi:MAG: glycosyltransferase family 2 protein [Ignavibacterium sp.]|nr:glycosyltransferase family 2 protein [Ignavibacterium sp.]
MKVGIIIVTYNSQKDIKRILDSLTDQSYKDFIVYVIDNNSVDDTLKIVELYQNEFSIHIIRSKINNGYAKGNNIGILKAMEDGCEFVFILNPDMKLEDKCIEILFKRIISDEKIGVVGPIVVYGNRPDNIIQGFGVDLDFRTLKRKYPFSERRLSDEIPSERYTGYAHGGAMMIRCSVLKFTGLFEEDYFMYKDEIDISYRINKAGFKILCISNAIAWHFHNFDKMNKKGYNLIYYYGIRNKYLYFKKYNFYSNLFFSLIKDIFIFPVKLRWAHKLGNIKLLKFYYLGVLDGLLGKKGFSNKSFN